MKTFLLSVFAITISAARAEQLVAPTGTENRIGDNAMTVGFGSGGDLQLVYGRRNFSQAVQINGIAFRLDEQKGGLSIDVTVPTVVVRMSTYGGTIGQFNTTAYDFNKGSDDALVFSGSVHWVTTDLPSETVPNSFDLAIMFSRPFFYDPAAGSLLISYSTRGATKIAADLDGHLDPTIGWFSYGPGSPGLGSIVARFDVTPVPEPGTAALFLAGCGCFGLAGLGKRSWS